MQENLWETEARQNSRNCLTNAEKSQQMRPVRATDSRCVPNARNEKAPNPTQQVEIACHSLLLHYCLLGSVNRKLQEPSTTLKFRVGPLGW